MQCKDKKTTLASKLAGLLLWAYSGKKQKVDTAECVKKDLSTGFSRRNIRFNERLRDTFRHRWLKISKD